MPTNERSNAPFTVHDLQEINPANWAAIFSFFYELVSRKIWKFYLPLEDIHEITLFCIERARRGSTSPRCKGIGSLVVMARMVALSRAIDICRRQVQMNCVPLESKIEVDGGERPNPNVIQEEVFQWRSAQSRAGSRELVEHALNRLAPEERKLIENVDLDGISIPTVARELGVTRNTVDQRLYRARKSLKQAIVQLQREGAE